MLLRFKQKNLRNRELNSGLLRDRQGQQPLYYCGSATQPLSYHVICTKATKNASFYSSSPETSDRLLDSKISLKIVANIIILLLYKQQQNMKSRNREFGDARNKNLAMSTLNQSMRSYINPTSRYQNAASNQSFTSSFVKKAKPDVCVTCVNKKIVVEKKTKEVNDKAKQIEQFKTQMQFKNAQKDLAKECRQKMLKQASVYNKSLINTHRNSADFEKMSDSRYISELLQKESKQAQQQKQRLGRQNEMTLKYRKELYLQYKNEEQRKMQQKLDKLKPQVNQLNLKHYDKSKMIKEYSTELKKQISNNNLRKYTAKQKEIEEEKQILEMSQKQFLKYTQFLKDDKHTHNSINPEVFEQLHLMDYAKKMQKIQERQSKNKERQEQLSRQRELYKSETQRSIKLKRDYEAELKQQMTQKYLKNATQRDEDLTFEWKVEKYTEDILKQSKRSKPCEQCKHSYDEKCLA